MKKVLSVLALTGFVAVGLASSASAITIPADTAFKMKYSNWEEEVKGDGIGNDNGIIDLKDEVLHGIAKITSIEDLFGNTLWAPGPSPTEELTAVFGGLVAATVNYAPTYEVFFSGGNLKIYHDTTPDFNPDKLTGGGWGDGNLWLAADFVPGIIPGDTNTTLHSTVTSFTSPFTGKGSGFLHITGGSAAGSLFERDVYGPGLDLLLESDVRAPGAGGGAGWANTSEDPISGKSPVPEPATMTLLGMGLMGTGFFSRKRRK